MPLKQLINKNNLMILGLNSGTSSDGVDLAAVKISYKNQQRKINFIHGSEIKYPLKLRNMILQTADSNNISLDQIVYLDNLLGRFMGQAANRFIKNNSKIKIDFIASHGQTVRHLPQKKKILNVNINGTMQLSSADFIAALTGKIVVSDFRQAEIALGSEGAPITTNAVHKIMIGKEKGSLILVNIGGMSNYFYFPKSCDNIKAADCGPGSSLIDLVSAKLFGLKYDKNGKLASRGKLSQRLLTLVSSNTFFQNRTVSTGREHFGEELVEKIIKYAKKLKIDKHDILRSVTELTAISIAHAVTPILKKDRKISKLYLTGGGRKNIFLVSCLKDKLNDIEILPVEKLGINGDYLEAASYAVMGEAALRSDVTNNRNLAINERSLPVCGKISQPPIKIRKR